MNNLASNLSSYSPVSTLGQHVFYSGPLNPSGTLSKIVASNEKSDIPMISRNGTDTYISSLSGTSSLLLFGSAAIVVSAGFSTSNSRVWIYESIERAKLGYVYTRVHV